MRIKMLKVSAGPGGIRRVGEIYEVLEGEAQALIGCEAAEVVLAVAAPRRGGGAPVKVGSDGAPVVEFDAILMQTAEQLGIEGQAAMSQEELTAAVDAAIQAREGTGPGKLNHGGTEGTEREKGGGKLKGKR